MEITTDLVIKTFLARSLLCQLIAICIPFTKEIFATKWRPIDCVCFVVAVVCLLHNLVNLALNSRAFILSKQQQLKSTPASLAAQKYKCICILART